MIAVVVGTEPVDLAASLSLSAGGVWKGRCQNRGPATLYRAVATSAPDPSMVKGWRHAAGNVWSLTCLETADGSQWVWTARDTTTLILESGQDA